jgi:hypothetical protein
MPRPPYRALGVALRVFSVLFAIGGLFMIFGSRGLIIRVFLHPPEAEVSTFEGDGVIRQLWVMVDTMKDEHLSSQDRLNVKGDYLFLRTTKVKRPDGKVDEYIRLVEFDWNNGSPRHRVICNLGRKELLAPHAEALLRLLQGKATAVGAWDWGVMLVKKLLEFQTIGERLNGTAYTPAPTVSLVTGFRILPHVYAQSKMAVPEWAQRPRFDNTSLYFDCVTLPTDRDIMQVSRE